ncbi:TniB family NTP-binding protein [Paenibacillus zanthoxyli]|uniref:TniB family NTP-binding protein n=1 Tax=Paenibacillus zanthoxyli TaxID=369399 RepID=UPI00046ED43D|nr:TniB family NTP-binding protein [Paenibacillus zanthoxyli]
MSHEEVKDLARRIKKLFIQHEEVTRIWSRLDSMRVYIEPDELDDEDEDVEKDPRHLFITGLSGVGKSQIGKRYAKSIPRYTEIVDDEEIDIVPVLYVKLPYPFTQLDFYKKILKALGTENFRRDARVNMIKDRVLLLLKKQKVQMIIFDEMNFIMRTKNFDNQTAMEMLKDLTNEHQVSIVCLGTPQIEKLHTMEDEYVRRFGRDHIDRFENCNEKFYELLRKIEEAIQPPIPIGLHDEATGLPRLLHFYSQGRIGYLHLIIKEAFRLLNVFDQKYVDYSNIRLTVDVLKQAKFNLFRESDHLIRPENAE